MALLHPRALRIVGVYLLVAGGYILLSDALVEGIVEDPHVLTQVQSFKGLGFVLVTAAGLGWHLTLHLNGRDRLERQLREERFHYSQLFRQSPVSLLELDDDNRTIRDVNPAAEALLQSPADRLRGSRLDTWLAPVEDGPERPALDSALGWRTRVGFYCHPPGGKDPRIFSLHRVTRATDPSDRKQVALLDLTDIIAQREALEAAVQRLRQLSLRLESIREDEKKDLADLLHDDLGQWLVALRLDLHALVGSKPEDPRAREVLQTLETVIDRSRNLTRRIRPAILEADDLPDAIQWLAASLEQDYNLSIDVEIGQGWQPLSRDANLALYRFVHEGLTNVRKHAGVDHAVVRLEPAADGTWLLAVEDAGQGLSRSRNEGNGDFTFGLLNMRERAEAVGGSFTLENRDDGPGTRAAIHFRPDKIDPVPARRHA